MKEGKRIRGVGDLLTSSERSERTHTSHFVCPSGGFLPYWLFSSVGIEARIVIRFWLCVDIGIEARIGFEIRF
jgi:hypothetical protein